MCDHFACGGLGEKVAKTHRTKAAAGVLISRQGAWGKRGEMFGLQDLLDLLGNFDLKINWLVAYYPVDPVGITVFALLFIGIAAAMVAVGLNAVHTIFFRR